MRTSTLTAQAIDDVLAGSFPASDPPAWTPGLARLAPVAREAAADAGDMRQDASAPVPGVIDVSRPAGSERTLRRAFVSLLAAAALTVLVPIVVLAVGTPVALAVRAVLEAAGRLLGLAR
jgi:hypothetical protein